MDVGQHTMQKISFQENPPPLPKVYSFLYTLCVICYLKGRVVSSGEGGGGKIWVGNWDWTALGDRVLINRLAFWIIQDVKQQGRKEGRKDIRIQDTGIRRAQLAVLRPPSFSFTWICSLTQVFVMIPFSLYLLSCISFTRKYSPHPPLPIFIHILKYCTRTSDLLPSFSPSPLRMLLLLGGSKVDDSSPPCCMYCRKGRFPDMFPIGGNSQFFARGRGGGLPLSRSAARTTWSGIATERILVWRVFFF